MQKASMRLIDEDDVKNDESNASSQRFHSLTDSAGTAIAVTDLKGNFIYVNQALADLLDYSIENLIGQPFKKFIHPADKGKVIWLFLRIRLLQRQPRTLEFRVIDRSGKTHNLWTKPTRLQVNGKTIGFQAVIVDVTDLKKTEEDLKQSDKKSEQTSILLDKILFTMSDNVFVIDENYNQIFVNEAARKSVGAKIGEKCYRTKNNRNSPCHRSGITCEVQEILKKRRPYLDDVRTSGASGKITQVRARPITTLDGKQAVLTVARDITTEVNASKNLERSEHNHQRTLTFLNNILCHMSDAVAVIDKDYTIRFLNEAAKKYYGYVLEKKCYKVFRNRDSPCHKIGIKCEIHELLEKGKPSFKDTRSGGNTGKILEIRATPLLDDMGGRSVLSVSRDVTEEKKVQDELANSLSLIRSVCDSTVDGILVVDENKRIKQYNKNLVEMFAIPNFILESGDDRSLSGYFLENIKDSNKMFKRTQELFDTPETESKDLFEWKDGRIFEQYSQPYKVNGKTNGRVVSLRDITRQKQMEHKIRRHSEHLAELVKQKTEDLMVSEQFLKATIQSIPDHFYIKDKNLKVILANDSYCKFHGKPKEEILDQTDYSLYPKTLADIFKRQDEQVFQKGQPIHTPDIPLKAADGSIRTIYAMKAPLKNMEGKVTHILGIARDVTDRKRAEEHFEKTFNLSVEMICIAGMDGYFKRVNPSFTKILEYEPQELLSKPFIEFVHPDDRQKTIDTIKECMTKKIEIFKLQIRLRSKKGSYKWLSMTGKVLHEEGISIIIARDVTEQKKLDDFRNQFTSIMTHELRTPLTAINAYMDLVLNGKLGILPENLESVLRVVKNNSDRLLKMSNDLLDIKKIESGNMSLNLENLNLQELIEDTCREIKPLIDEKKQNLQIGLSKKPLMVKGDHIRLSQIFMNLLSNANKFTSEGGHITIRAREIKNTIQVKISDTGNGIRKEDLKRVFTPFANIQKPTYIKGTGLGLSITKKLLRSHNGKITVQSEGEGKGTTFTLTFLKSSK